MFQGQFVPALKRLLSQNHPNLSAKDESLEYVESLILKLLAMLSSKPPPQSVTVSTIKQFCSGFPQSVQSSIESTPLLPFFLLK